MIGNAVPVNFANALAIKIKEDLNRLSNQPLSFSQKGKVQLNNIKNSYI